jgi:hypothetical protein
MGFGFRLMPGVRLRVSSRGVSAGLGPRVARVHVGRGVGFSSGVGPFSAYTSLSSGRRRSYGGGGGVTQARQDEAQLRREARDAAVEAVQDTTDRLTHLHLVDFSPAQRPIVRPPPPPVTAAVAKAMVQARYKVTRRGISWLDRSGRRRARVAAQSQIDAEQLAVHHRNEVERARAQQVSDEGWRRLCAGDPATVISALNRALSDNEQRSAAVSFESGEASVVIFTPPFEQTPDTYATETPGGRATTKRLTKTQRNDLYQRILLGHVLVTLKEVFAVAPPVQRARTVVVDRTPAGDLAVLFAGVHERDFIVGLQRTETVEAVLSNGADVHFNLGGRTSELRPIDLDEEPDLRDLLRKLQTSRA